jgi:predicted metal-dependent TIM-barrel fold hydrolase
MDWKRAFYAALVLLAASNLGWMYVVVDHGVTDTYQEVVDQETRAGLGVMKRLVPRAAPLTRADVLTLLRQTNPDAFIVNTDTSVILGGLHFEFEQERLVRVGGLD